jgi:hypothetical protein
MLKPRCADCRYWETTDSDIGDCRRAPPGVSTLAPEAAASGGALRAVWPQTATADWCGEFERIEHR